MGETPAISSNKPNNRIKKYNPKIPAKPLACYKGQHPRGIQYLPPELCTPENVLLLYQTRAVVHEQDCSPENICPGEENLFYYQLSSTCKEKKEICREEENLLPVIAQKIGALHSGPLENIIPLLDINGIDDMRSSEVML